MTFGDWGNMVKVFTLHIGPTMSFILYAWQLVFIILASWVNRRQQQVNEFQRVQIQVLLEKLGKKRILLGRRSATTAGRQR